MGYKKLPKYRNVNEELEAMFHEEPTFPKLEPNELDDFGDFLAAFRISRDIEFPKPATITYLDMKAAMEAFQATRKGAVVIETDHLNRDGRPVYKVTKYQQFWDRFNQWSAREERRAYAKMKDLEGLQEVADTMTV